jgi:hypothetical protein
LSRFIYTGSVDVTPDIAQDLLRAADQYLLEGLKRLCEYTIAQVSLGKLVGWTIFTPLFLIKITLARYIFVCVKWVPHGVMFLSQDILLENVSSMYELSEAFNAISLRHTCILFILEHFDKLSTRPGY